MLNKIDHIGVAVRSLDEAVGFYRAMGAEPYHFEEVPSQKVRVAFIKVGESNIELLEPTAPDSPVAIYLEKRGEGMHHICYNVDDVAAGLATLKDAGYRLIDEAPKPGAHGCTVAFVHPKSTNSVLTELSQHGEHEGH
ncbi:methylmalonyl-CoA epimerase [Chrysiogenes arsenatis]|uniref:methylmalonyl-CoA epimerase n=1 Tax=Chrysiogenes arsenatis TaxID=309797 RepID=UPI0004248DF8|nr:methylmalonyl-CoA epimerase [Chrysiogenes arsenatis]